MTPLHVAAKSARFQVVVYLADQGNNINTKDSDGVSIVFMCISEGNFFFWLTQVPKNELLHLHNQILGFVMH